MPTLITANTYISAWLALGANLGAAENTISQAIRTIAQWQHTQLIRASSLYQTAPIEATGNDYINAVVEISTQLSPQHLLQQCQAAEAAAGRQRSYRNAPRTLDIDVLLYGDQHIHQNNLTIPHPRMYQRAFVLVPLAEIAPHMVTPAQLDAVRHQTITRIADPIAP